ncbi:hypothetical protein GCM10028772_04580 [Nocardioides ultimimeridianus]
MARARRYLAVVVTGGIAVGGGLTVAAARLGPPTAASRPHGSTASRPRGAHAAQAAHRTRHATSPVRAVPHPRRAARPAATTHSS